MGYSHRNLRISFSRGAILLSAGLIILLSTACGTVELGGSPAFGRTYQGPILEITMLKMVKVPQVTYSSFLARPFSVSTKTVVEAVEDRRKEVSLAQARRINPEVALGDRIEIESLLNVTLLDLFHVQEIFSLEDDQPTNHIRPSSKDRHFVVIRAFVTNRTNTPVQLNFDHIQAQLETDDGIVYDALNIPNPEVFYYYEEEGQSKNLQLIRGVQRLEENFELHGYLVFEIPTLAKIANFTWRTGDNVVIDFEGYQSREILKASSEDTELVLIHARVGNHAATNAQLDMNSEPAQLRSSDGGKYLSLKLPDSKAQYQYENAGQRISIPIIRGVQELEKSFELNGWLIFDVPKSASLDRFRWSAGGDVIIVTF